MSTATARKRILVVEDDRTARATLAALLRREGYLVDAAPDGFRGLGKLANRPDVVLADIRMPGMDGLELLRRVHGADPRLPVILMTAQGTIPEAVEAMQAGALNYITKPLQLPELIRALRAATEHTCTARPRATDQFGHLVAASPAMQELVRAAAVEARSNTAVLLSGETGTGKRSLAEAIHHTSGREHLVHRHAHAGITDQTLPARTTLLVSEVEALGEADQVTLTELLDERKDVRVIASTRLSPKSLQERLRPELWFRINAVTLLLPPLRARREDIVPLALQQLRQLGAERAGAPTRLGEDAVAQLLAYDWPGNVRELRAVIRTGASRARCDTIYADDLALVPTRRAPAIPGAPLAEIERHAILTTLEHVGGRKVEAAHILGISPRKIQYKLHEYGAVTRRR